VLRFDSKSQQAAAIFNAWRYVESQCEGPLEIEPKRFLADLGQRMIEVNESNLPQQCAAKLFAIRTCAITISESEPGQNWLQSYEYEALACEIRDLLNDILDDLEGDKG
jgi:hypothetical protein